MRLHTDTLTAEDIRTAANWAGVAGHGRVYVDSLTRHGSRSRRQAWDVKLTGDGSHSRRRTNSGTYGAGGRWESDFAATYDSWGYFFAMLYNIDPAMTCYAYGGADDFHAKTDHKFHAPAHVL